MVASAELSVGQTNGSGTEKSEADSTVDSTKKTSGTSTSAGTTTGTQTTSGSVNTSEILGGNSQTNSGSTNISDITGGTITGTSGSRNTTGTNASQNIQTNSGSTNVTTQGGRTGGSRTAESVNTSQLLLSQEAMDYQINNILGGVNGLAAVSSGKNMAGIYNDTGTTFLTNDLIVKAAGEVASRGAVTRQVIGATETENYDSGFKTTQELGGSSVLTDLGATSGFQNIGSSVSSSNTNQKNTTAIGGSTSSGTTSQQGTQNIGGATTSQAGTSSQVNTTETLESLTSKTIALYDKETSEKKTEIQAKAKGGWIVCTELKAQGRMPARIYVTGLAVFKTYDPKYLGGYYIWAEPAVIHLRENPESKLSKFLEITLNARAEYLTACVNPRLAKKTILGWITTHVGWKVCQLLALTIARDYKEKEYSNA